VRKKTKREKNLELEAKPERESHGGKVPAEGGVGGINGPGLVRNRGKVFAHRKEWACAAPNDPREFERRMPRT